MQAGAPSFCGGTAREPHPSQWAGSLGFLNAASYHLLHLLSSLQDDEVSDVVSGVRVALPGWIHPTGRIPVGPPGTLSPHIRREEKPMPPHSLPYLGSDESHCHSPFACSFVFKG